MKANPKPFWCETYKKFSDLSSKSHGRSLALGVDCSRLTSINEDTQRFMKCDYYFWKQYSQVLEKTATLVLKAFPPSNCENLCFN